MDYEKKYKEMVRRAKELYESGNALTRQQMGIVCPELTESEDEKIRRFLLRLAERCNENSIDFMGDIKKKDVIAYLEKQKEQKPAEWKPLEESMEALLLAIEGKWDAIKPTGYMSRRLEDLYDGLVNTFNIRETYLPKTNYTEKDIEELKTLKSKIDASMEQKPTEWSEEDEKMLSDCIEEVGSMSIRGDVKTLRDWLKSLPERLNLQPKQEWSEEDKRKLKMLYSIVSQAADAHAFFTTTRLIGDRDAIELHDFLKSLRPQSHWKPSEEQMEALERASTNEYLSAKQFDILVSLYEQLKKLM